MRILFTRHGESHANLLHEISNRGLRHGLSQRGCEQARSLAHLLESRQITHLYSSPILRAIETSIVIAHHLNLEYEVSDALREYDCGIMEGRADEEAWAAWKTLYDAWTIERRYDTRIEGGECFHDLCARFDPLIDRLIAQHGDSDAAVLCVAHGGIYLMMLPRILKNIDQEFVNRVGVAHTSCITAELRSGGLWCTEWNGMPLSAVL